MELKPCPFCGATPKRQKHKSYGGSRLQHRVIDGNLECAVFPATHWLDTPEEATEAWNRRAKNDYEHLMPLLREEDFPAADVRPVVRGRWLKKSESQLDGVFSCSNCRDDIDIEIDIGDWEETPLDKGFLYCPSCGADMREG